MSKFTIIATSLNESSKSQQLAKIVHDKLGDDAHSLFDMRQLDPPFAGSNEGWEYEGLLPLKESVEQSSHIIFAVPIYCYDVNAVAKNIIELIGRSFTNKVIGFICSAGGTSSYMSVMGFANHLMLDFRSVITPRFVYVDPSGWNDDQLNDEILDRLDLLIDDMKSIQVSAS